MARLGMEEAEMPKGRCMPRAAGVLATAGHGRAVKIG